MAVDGTTGADQLNFYWMLMNLGTGDNDVWLLKEETVKKLPATSTRPKSMNGYFLGLVADFKRGIIAHGDA